MLPKAEEVRIRVSESKINVKQFAITLPIYSHQKLQTRACD